MIELTITSPVATITLCRPPVNAIDAELVARLNRALDEAEAAPKVSILRLRSAQKVFCAGADLGMMQGLLATSEGRDRMIAVIRDFQALFARIEKSPLLSVAELGGATVGGGLELALACDLRIAGEGVKIGLPEARLGLLPAAGGTQRLTRICGDAPARRLILGAEIIDGREALRLGLVQWTAPDDELKAATDALVDRLAVSPPEAIAACKRCIGAALDQHVDGYELELVETRRLHDTDETRQRVDAFLRKSA